jgi:hypothetical protein
MNLVLENKWNFRNLFAENFRLRVKQLMNGGAVWSVVSLCTALFAFEMRSELSSLKPFWEAISAAFLIKATLPPQTSMHSENRMKIDCYLMNCIKFPIPLSHPAMPLSQLCAARE